MAHLQICELISAPRMDVFDYLTNPVNLKELLAPAVDVELLTPELPLKRGSEAHFNMTRIGLTQSVRFRLEDVVKGARLTYRQTEGLFANWMHTLKFEDHADKVTLVTDIVDYTLPLGLLGHLVDDLMMKVEMERLLTKRLEKAKLHFL